MRLSKSFIDLLFILLCSVTALLIDTMRVGAIDTRPVKVGAGHVATIEGRPSVVVVSDDGLTFEGASYQDAAALASALSTADAVVLSVRDGSVGHHRVMQVWSALADEGIVSKLAAQPVRVQKESQR